MNSQQEEIKRYKREQTKWAKRISCWEEFKRTHEYLIWKLSPQKVEKLKKDVLTSNEICGILRI